MAGYDFLDGDLAVLREIKLEATVLEISLNQLEIEFRVFRNQDTGDGRLSGRSRKRNRGRGRFGVRSFHILADFERGRKKEGTSLAQLTGTTYPSTHQLHQPFADG